MFSKKIKIIVFIEGMSCEHCANKVKMSIEKMDNVKKVKVNLSEKKATILCSKMIDVNKLKEQIENLDYKVVDIVDENK